MNSPLLERAARGLFRSKAAKELFFRRLAVIESLRSEVEQDKRGDDTDKQSRKRQRSNEHRMGMA